MRAQPLGRRGFLRVGGTALASALLPPAAEALERSETLFASACILSDGRFGAALLSQDGEVLLEHPLPARGHDVVFDPPGSQAVVFARRPGSFACRFSTDRKIEPFFFSCPADRHFYGHGVFSNDGLLLFATENDFENAVGMIGIYDASDGFRRLGEFRSHGIGPHDVQLLPGGRLLAVANGGIETHPDYGRAKLNIATMEPSLAILDSTDGSLLHREVLPETLSKVSLRHMAGDQTGRLWLAGQFEGDPARIVPLLFSWDESRGFKTVELSTDVTSRLKGYVGSVAYNAQSGHLAIASPKGGVVLTCPVGNPERATILEQRKACGVAASLDGFLVTSMEGTLRADQMPTRISSTRQWDNHVARVRRHR